ncbi:hypothetical protein IWQ62_004356 [Dispira parvispora]|uniref:Uncharacterized protein n=1 Tax=Dispira parvispora TaxID=1520584 RepID=A0A9W8AS08_9FUNG|nr:hypothetical protein IWQ62_004356 [Dispira parvispora]
MQGFIFKRRQREQVWWYLAWLLVLTVVVGLYPVYGATQLLNGGDLLPKKVPSQDFYYDDVKHYHYRGPLVKMDIKEDCKVTVNEVPRLTTSDWAASAGMAANESDVGTMVFFDRLEFMDGKCQTFTDVLKQLEGIAQKLTDKGYPPVKVGLFSCALTSESTFGGLDYEPIDDYYYHKAPGMEIAQIGLDTGLMFANVTAGLAANATDGNFVPLVVQVTQEPGPWNEFLFSSAFKGYLIFYYITFAPGILYAVYEFFRLMKKSKCRFQPRFFIFFSALYFLSVNIVLHPAAALSRVQNVFRFTSWILGYPSLYFVLIIWIRITRKVIKWRFLFLLIWLLYFNFASSVTANFILIIWSVTQISFILYFGWGIHSYAGSVGMCVLAVIMIIYGIHIMRALRKLEIFSDTKAALQRLSLLSYVAFLGGLTISVGMLLVATSITQYVQVTLTRTLLFHISSLIIFISIFWILRVRESSALKRRELRLVSGGDESGPGAVISAPTENMDKPHWEVPLYTDETSTATSNLKGSHPDTTEFPKPWYIPSTLWNLPMFRRYRIQNTDSLPPPAKKRWSISPWKSRQRSSDANHHPSNSGLHALSEGKFGGSTTCYLGGSPYSSQAGHGDKLAAPTHNFYFPGGYYPSTEGLEEHREGISESESVTTAKQVRDADNKSVEDYPNPLEYFIGPKLAKENNKRTSATLSTEQQSSSASTVDFGKVSNLDKSNR